MMKRCYDCGEYKEATKANYHKNRSRPDGWQDVCRDCKRVRNAKTNSKQTRYYRWVAYIKNRYGLTVERYWAILKAQDYACAVCGQVAVLNPDGAGCDLCVDHDHDTGRVRGFLCNNHNVGIGMYDNDIHMLVKAIDYLLNSRKGVLHEYNPRQEGTS